MVWEARFEKQVWLHCGKSFNVVLIVWTIWHRPEMFKSQRFSVGCHNQKNKTGDTVQMYSLVTRGVDITI